MLRAVRRDAELYDTFGFPYDLTEDALRARGLTVDRAGFDAAMAEQKAAARAAWKGSGETASDDLWYDLAEEVGATAAVASANVAVSACPGRAAWSGAGSRGAAPVEAPVHGGLDAAADRLEGGGHGQVAAATPRLEPWGSSRPRLRPSRTVSSP